MPADSPAFKAHVLEWVRDSDGLNVRDAQTVESVSGYGTDWAGDTAGGFYSDFEVTVVYTDASGSKHSRDVRGDDLESLWRHVVNLW